MFSHTAVEAARRDAMRQVDTNLNLILSRLENGLTNARLKPKIERFILEAVTSSNVEGVVTMANIPARLAATDAMIQALTEHCATKQNVDGFRYWMLTICIDLGVAWVGKPSVDVPKLQRLVDKTMRAYGLQGVHLIEDDILMTLPGERCQRLLYHVHAAVWRTKGLPIKPRKLAEAISRGKAFTNDLGARPVDFATVAEQTPKSVVGLAAYVTKWGVCVKRRRKSDDRKGGYRLDVEPSCYTPVLTLQTVLRYLQLPLYSMVRGVGPEGKAVRARWKALMSEWEAAQRTDGTPAVKVTERRIRTLIKGVRRAKPFLAPKFRNGLRKI